MSGFDRLQKYDALEGRTFVICVGAMKCATSWIFHFLAGLPDVVVSPLKELHFFNVKFAANALSDMEGMAVRRLAFHVGQEGDPVHKVRMRPTYQASIDRVQMIYDDNAYFGHFARLCQPDTRMLCDITPAYSTVGPDGFEYMRDFCATQGVRLKILFVMRDPVERLWSQLRHMTHASPKSDLTAKWNEALQSPRIMARAEYRFTVQDIDAVFPSGDVMYLFYEDLFGEAAQRKLAEFCDTEFRPGDSGQVHNRTALELDLSDAARAAFREALATQYDFCSERFAGQLPASWMI